MLPENSNLLTINGGSSSIKFAMYEMAEDPVPVFSGSIDRIGSDDAVFKVLTKTRKRRASMFIHRAFIKPPPF